MKFAMFVSSLLFSALVHAEARPPGSFLPTACSTPPSANEVVADVVAVESVCFGKLVQQEGQALQLKLNDGSVRIYSIRLEDQLGGLGVSKTAFSGNVFGIRMVDPIEGTLTMVNGVTVSYQIEFSTRSNLDFVGQMMPVFITM